MILEYVAKYSNWLKTAASWFLPLICGLFIAINAQTTANATENILVYPDARHLNISDYTSVYEPATSVVVQVIRPADDEKKTMNILSADGSSPLWFSFALTNPSKVDIERYLVAPHFGGGNDGVFMPKLSGKRIEQLYSSQDKKPELQNIAGSDVYSIIIPAEKTVTFVARVAQSLPNKLSLWDIGSFNKHQIYLPFYQGLMIGVFGLLAIFISGLLVVKRDILLAIVAAICWSALAFSLQEFGFITVILPENAYSLSFIRAVSEVIMANLPLLMLYLFFNRRIDFVAKNIKSIKLGGKVYKFNITRLAMLFPLLIAAVALLIAPVSPALAATIARLNALLVIVMGFALIVKYWPTAKFAIAQTVLPIWVIFSLWAVAQIYVALGSDLLYMNLVVGAFYALFLLMSFVALLQYFIARNAEEYTLSGVDVTEQSSFNSATFGANKSVNSHQNNLSNLAIAGSGQVLWEWDLIEGMIKCGTDLDDLLNYGQDTMTQLVSEWIGYLHAHDMPKFENALSVILEDGNSRIDQDFRLRNAQNEYLWFELRAVALTDDEGYLTSFVGTLKEVTHQKTSEDRLFQDAVHDSLTGLPRRSLFMDRLERAILRAKSDKKTMPALLIIDIDRFKQVNDSVGIAMGDNLLMTVARRLENYGHGIDTVARLGADQFAIILIEYADQNAIATLAENLRSLIAEPILLGRREVVLNTSIGMALAEDNNDAPSELLHNTELALDTAKQVDQPSVIFYSVALNGKGGEKFNRENDLRQAIARNEFEMLFQPIISLKTMRPVGFEALIRWHHPVEGDILPSEFIKLAEDTGHIHQLGKFALLESVKQLNIWQRTFSHSDPLFVSVNMSSLELFQPKLVEQVQEVLSRFNVIHSTLKLEVTESLVMKNPELARQILTRLKDAGAGLCCDDFGTGHSSLSYLHQFPFDVIKIDRSFINGENFGDTRPIILKAIIHLARDLGLKVVAEGIETDDQALELIDLGCEWGQGFRFGEPMNAKDSLNFLSANYA
ncbi:MAG: EAL domain-containing protein [Rhizobiales bacterium]|nr:EAL domain-containing protein [Hyphomicrobiales bacterium]NRB13522.1 EAL domain-containing protein [Hyphomicrobiales bacterium]